MSKPNEQQEDNEQLSQGSALNRRATRRLLWLFSGQRFYPEIHQLLKQERPGTVAAFILYAEGVSLDGTSLSKQFTSRYIGTFPRPRDAERAIVQDFLFRHGALRADGAGSKEAPLADDLPQSVKKLRIHPDKTLAEVMSALDGYAVFRTPWNSK